LPFFHAVTRRLRQTGARADAAGGTSECDGKEHQNKDVEHGSA
jgi:hypothetical protein